MYFLDMEEVLEGADKKAIPAKAQEKLPGQDQRNSQPETELAGLVPKKMHSYQTAEAAAQERDRPNSPFRDSTKSLDSIVLIHKHNHKPKGIDYKEIKKD